jgi:elongation factor Ts
MEITTELIKRLRDKTGAGMMDCKRALEASNGEIEQAIEFLRKKGAALAQKRADRTAKEGAIVARVNRDGQHGILVEINCETDFVARSDDFSTFAAAVADAIVQGETIDPTAAVNLKTDSGKTIGELMSDLLAKVGEKIDVRRIRRIVSVRGTVSSYVHLGNKIGVLVEIEGLGANESDVVGRNVAMQIAAMNPMVVSREQVSKEIIDREMEIYKTQATNEGKPAQIVERIALGKLEKFFQEVCLTEQTYIKDPAKTIREFLAGAGAGVVIKGFERLHLGEE